MLITHWLKQVTQPGQRLVWEGVSAGRCGSLGAADPLAAVYHNRAHTFILRGVAK